MLLLHTVTFNVSSNCYCICYYFIIDKCLYADASYEKGDIIRKNCNNWLA